MGSGASTAAAAAAPVATPEPTSAQSCAAQRAAGVGVDVPPSASQRSYATVGAAVAPALRTLASAVRARPQPCAPQLPTRIAGDTKFATPPEEVERALRELQAGARAWAATPYDGRAAVARACAARCVAVTEETVAAAVSYKGSYEAGDAEERRLWLAGVSLLSGLADSLDLLAAGKQPAPAEVRWRDAGGEPQAVLRVFPATLAQHVVAQGQAGHLWLRPDATPAPGGAARAGGDGTLCLLLGAGNHAMLSVADVATKCIMEGAACILKMNPVNEWAGPHLAAGLAPLLDAGALRIVYGGADVGAALASHPAVQAVHITGSDKTYDALVWGPGAKKRAGAQPPLRKPVTAELGCVTPYVLVPGAWSEADIEAKAADVAAMVASNASCNCLAAKVLILGRHWAQREQFLAALRQRFAALPPRAAFYPGSAARYDTFAKAYPGAEAIGAAGTTDAGLRVLPWLLLPPGPPVRGELALTQEAWSPVLALRELDAPAGDVPAFLDAAAAAVNDLCWGTLSCTVYIDPATEQAHAAAFDSFVAALRYGAIGINVPSVMVYVTPGLTWGAFPGHTPDNVGSGVGVVANTHMYPDVQKSVLRAPWQRADGARRALRQALDNGLTSSHAGRLADPLMGPAASRALVAYLAQPSAARAALLALRALRGS